MTKTIIEEKSAEYYDSMIDEKRAAEFLGYSVRALQNWRVRGGGLNFAKNLSAFYLLSPPRSYCVGVEARIGSNTSQAVAY
jgi:hypothetical protein